MSRCKQIASPKVTYVYPYVNCNRMITGNFHSIQKKYKNVSSDLKIPRYRTGDDEISA